jgi:hypothetical protein
MEMMALQRNEIDDTAEGIAADEWENRRLCSDENCIGVIGPDGRCKECGKPHGSEAIPHAQVPEPNPAAERVDLRPVTDDPGEPDADEWRNRRLCSDENCIGVIGPDGRCRECSKPYSA